MTTEPKMSRYQELMHRAQRAGEELSSVHPEPATVPAARMATLSPERFESVACPTCKQPAGSPCVIKRRRRYQEWDYHIARQVRSMPTPRQREAAARNAQEAN